MHEPIRPAERKTRIPVRTILIGGRIPPPFRSIPCFRPLLTRGLALEIGDSTRLVSHRMHFRQGKNVVLLSAVSKHKKLTENPMTRIDVFRMIKRRALAAGLPYSTCCHTFMAVRESKPPLQRNRASRRRRLISRFLNCCTSTAFCEGNISVC